MEQLLAVLIPLLLTIEGSNRDNVPPGDDGNAIGCLQIHKIYVREVNRILGENRYTYADRHNKNKSIEMAKIHIAYWSPKEMPGSLIDKLVILGRIHNAGPFGYNKKCSIPYAKKIKKEYYKTR